MSVLRSFVRRLILRESALRRISVAYSVENLLLPEILVRTPPAILRETLRLPSNEYYSQLNQDIFALLCNSFKPGFFVEVGANNGFNLSNTVYLEQCFHWHGLLIEANPTYLEDLSRRKAVIVNKAVAATAGVFEFVDAGLYGGIVSTLDQTHASQTESAARIKVPAATLAQILEENKAPREIDFISVDVEGGELPIIEQMCALKNYRFRAGCVEHNYRAREYDAFKAALNGSGYQVFWEGQTGHDLFFVDGRVVR